MSGRSIPIIIVVILFILSLLGYGFVAKYLPSRNSQASNAEGLMYLPGLAGDETRILTVSKDGVVSTIPLPTGAQGEKGEDGTDGVDGLPGIPGLKGDSGADGEDGAAGADGEKGETGATGATGPTGVPGDNTTNSFTDLTDAPDSYTGSAGKLVKVNSTETGLEFIAPSSIAVSALNSLVGAVTLQGTANQITITPSGNTLIFSLPQDIGTTSSPTFATMTITGASTFNGQSYTWPASQTVNGVLTTDGSGGLTWSAPAACATCFVNGGNTFGGLTTLGTNDANNLALETSGSTRLTIDTSGNVGIGKTNPTTKLYVYSTTNNDGISIDGTANPNLSFSNSGTIRSYLSLSTSAGSWSSDSLANDLVIRVNGSTQKILFNTGGGGLSTMSLHNGTVGIGTTTPTNYVFQVNNIGSQFGVTTLGTFYARATYSTYTADGVWNANSRPSIVNPGNYGGSAIRFGYHDAGGGQYYPSIGFGVNSGAINNNLLILQSRVFYGTAEANNRWQVSGGGTISWGGG